MEIWHGTLYTGHARLEIGRGRPEIMLWLEIGPGRLEREPGTLCINCITSWTALRSGMQNEIDAMGGGKRTVGRGGLIVPDDAPRNPLKFRRIAYGGEPVQKHVRVSFVSQETM